MDGVIPQEVMTDGASDDVIPRDVVSCKSCHEDCRDAKLLPCLHTFCRKCLEEVIASVTQGQSTIRCPMCGFSLGDRGEVSANTVLSNCLVNRLCYTGTENSTQDGESFTCQTMTCENRSSKRCVNCDESLCERCAVVHDNNDETSSHRIETLRAESDNNNADVVDNNGERDARIISIMTCCAKYDCFDVSAMFCVDCNMGLCESCHATRHARHRCTEVTAVAENFEVKIEQPLAQLEDMNNSLNKTISRINESVALIEHRRRDANNAITRRRELLVNLIYEYEATLLSEIERRFDKNLCCAMREKNSVEKRVSGIDAALKMADNLLEYGTDEEKVALRQPIGRRVRELCSQTIINEIIAPIYVDVTEPDVTVDTIGNIFGEINCANGDQADSCDSCDGRMELSDTDMDLGASGNSDSLRGETHRLGANGDGEFYEEIQRIPFSPAESPLDQPVHKFKIPAEIRRDCIKGIGVNDNGDVVIGVAHGDVQSVNLIEKRGILRGKIAVDKGWVIHTVSADGRIAQVMSRGDNRYRVRVINSNDGGFLVKDAHVESYGPSYVTANDIGQVIITASRYPQVYGKLGKAGKAGGNVSVHDSDGYLVNRITNEDLKDACGDAFDRPACIAVARDNTLVIADPGNHGVTALSVRGEFLFRHGGGDAIDTYDGPDAVCLDDHGNIVVTDRKQKRIDVMSREGSVRHTYRTREVPKFVTVTRDKRLLVATSDGVVAFYEYL